MGLAFRYFRTSLAEIYYDPIRMMLANLRWFVPSLPAFLVALFPIATLLNASVEQEQFLEATEATATLLLPSVMATVLLPLLMVLAGPATAAIYSVMHEFVRGELLEPSRFGSAFRRYFWSGWGLAASNVAAGTLLLLNAWFYLAVGIPVIGLLAIVFLYLFVVWFALQPYLFPLLVEFDQPIRRVWRNAIFMVMDNLGLTLGLLIIRGTVLAMVFSGLFFPVAPLILAVLLAQIDNRAVTEAIDRYRDAGRVFS